MNHEKLPVKIYMDNKNACFDVASRIAEIIKEKNLKGQKTVLGLATGHTPVNVYRELIRLHKEEDLDFSNVTTFNLDEYWPIDPNSLQSYNLWMRENLFNHINIKPENINIPRGDLKENEIDDFCRDYEKKIQQAGCIDFQILGIGRSGHIGFNEPGSDKTTKTRKVHLDKITRKDAASDFFGEENVPQTAISMGVGSILDAKEICLLAFGENKAPIIKKAVEGNITNRIAASFLQEHENSTFFLDEAAAAELTRIKTPWLVGSCIWDEQLKSQAVVWLSKKTKKPILKLTDEDYAENGLDELIRECGGTSYQLNIKQFRKQMKTITGWPGGKENHKRVLIFSPHPDDDVICMGGTIERLTRQDHEVHVAYMVSGYLSVFDHDVLRHSEFVKGFNETFGLKPKELDMIEKHIEEFLVKKDPGQIDSKEIQNIKALIRKTEAITAAKYCNVKEDNIHFLNLPFYDTGKVQKLNITDKDINIVYDLLEQTKPEMLYCAGDISDPHGTHRLCFEALIKALNKYEDEGNKLPQILLYRGAWQEWRADELDMAVPLAPDELHHKRFAIFKHESQKDRAMFPGPYDSREFWQRAEERNINLADTYNLLGLPEYHALEAFAEYPLQKPKQILKQMQDTNNS